MKTITLQEPGKFLLQDTPFPQNPAPGEALVRVHRVGVCGTDYHAFAGKQPFFSYPRILGHELGVEVLAIGPGVSNVKPGDKCSVEPYVNCTTCIACRQNRGNCCANMRVIGVHTDGGMREAFTLPARKLHPANQLSYDQITLVETLAIGAHAVDRADPQPGENILVIGAGPIGLSVIEFAKTKVGGSHGGNVIVMDVSDQRLTFVKNTLQIPHTINAKEGDPVEQVKALTNNEFPSIVIDATGNSASMNTALKFLANAGRLVYVGLHQGDIALPDPEFHRRETTLLASRNAHPADFQKIINALANGSINTTPWITHRAPAFALPETFPTWTTPTSGVLKAIIEFP